MTDRERLNDQDRDELIAYLDGELDEKRSRAWESRLMLEPAARAEADALRRTWDLLEYVPRPPAPSPTFTTRTLDRLGVIKPQPKPAWGPFEPLRSRWGVVWAAGLLLALAAGFLTTSGQRRVVRPQPGSVAVNGQTAQTQQLAADLRVVENLQVYENAQDIEFIQELEKLELFSDEI